MAMLFLPQHALHSPAGHKLSKSPFQKTISDHSAGTCSMPFVFYPNILCKGMQAYVLNVSVWCRIVQYVCLENRFVSVFVTVFIHPVSVSVTVCNPVPALLWTVLPMSFEHSMVLKSSTVMQFPRRWTEILFGLKIDRQQLNTEAYGDKNIRLQSSSSLFIDSFIEPF